NIYQLPKVLSLQSVPLQNVAVGNVALQNEATNSNSLNINNLNSNSTNKKERSRDSIKYSDEHLMLAQLLQNNLQSDFSREMAKVNIKKWADVIRLMEERDQLTIEQIEYVIKWLPTNSFWFGNIRSASKLREQFSKLVYEIKTEQAKAKQQKKSYGNVRKEQLPEWASNPEQVPQVEEDPAIKAELQRRLEEYQRKKAANDGA
ncbi:MAG TPA: phage replisome organizer, partial [Candidatus Enterococcus avicola]|nr:phage replisome organizer [Candidatus Enterococcus avicola]